MWYKMCRNQNAVIIDDDRKCGMKISLVNSNFDLRTPLPTDTACAVSAPEFGDKFIPSLTVLKSGKMVLSCAEPDTGKKGDSPIGSVIISESRLDSFKSFFGSQGRDKLESSKDKKGSMRLWRAKEMCGFMYRVRLEGQKCPTLTRGSLKIEVCATDKELASVEVSLKSGGGCAYKDENIQLGNLSLAGLLARLEDVLPHYVLTCNGMNHQVLGVLELSPAPVLTKAQVQSDCQEEPDLTRCLALKFFQEMVQNIAKNDYSSVWKAPCSAGIGAMQQEFEYCADDRYLTIRTGGSCEVRMLDVHVPPGHKVEALTCPLPMSSDKHSLKAISRVETNKDSRVYCFTINGLFASFENHTPLLEVLGRKFSAGFAGESKSICAALLEIHNRMNLSAN